MGWDMASSFNYTSLVQYLNLFLSFYLVMKVLVKAM